MEVKAYKCDIENCERLMEKAVYCNLCGKVCCTTTCLTTWSMGKTW